MSVADSAMNETSGKKHRRVPMFAYSGRKAGARESDDTLYCPLARVGVCALRIRVFVARIAVTMSPLENTMYLINNYCYQPLLEFGFIAIDHTPELAVVGPCHFQKSIHELIPTISGFPQKSGICFKSFSRQITGPNAFCLK